MALGADSKLFESEYVCLPMRSPGADGPGSAFTDLDAGEMHIWWQLQRLILNPAFALARL
jgi:hypothetical protein